MGLETWDHVQTKSCSSRAKVCSPATARSPRLPQGPWSLLWLGRTISDGWDQKVIAFRYEGGRPCAHHPYVFFLGSEEVLTLEVHHTAVSHQQWLPATSTNTNSAVARSSGAPRLSFVSCLEPVDGSRQWPDEFSATCDAESESLFVKYRLGVPNDFLAVETSLGRNHQSWG